MKVDELIGGYKIAFKKATMMVMLATQIFASTLGVLAAGPKVEKASPQKRLTKVLDSAFEGIDKDMSFTWFADSQNYFGMKVDTDGDGNEDIIVAYENQSKISVSKCVAMPDYAANSGDTLVTYVALEIYSNDVDCNITPSDIDSIIVAEPLGPESYFYRNANNGLKRRMFTINYNDSTLSIKGPFIGNQKDGGLSDRCNTYDPNVGDPTVKVFKVSSTEFSLNKDSFPKKEELGHLVSLIYSHPSFQN